MALFGGVGSQAGQPKLAKKWFAMEADPTGGFIDGDAVLDAATSEECFQSR